MFLCFTKTISSVQHGAVFLFFFSFSFFLFWSVLQWSPFFKPRAISNISRFSLSTFFPQPASFYLFLLSFFLFSFLFCIGAHIVCFFVYHALSIRLPFIPPNHIMHHRLFFPFLVLFLFFRLFTFSFYPPQVVQSTTSYEHTTLPFSFFSISFLYYITSTPKLSFFPFFLSSTFSFFLTFLSTRPLRTRIYIDGALCILIPSGHFTTLLLSCTVFYFTFFFLGARYVAYYYNKPPSPAFCLFFCVQIYLLFFLGPC